MPLPLEPGGVCRIVLSGDRHKKDPPTFLFQYLTGRQQRRLISFYDFSDPSAVDAVFDVLGEFLVGWEHLTEPFDPAALDTVINVAEAFELINLLVMQAPGGALKNGFGSPQA